MINPPLGTTKETNTCIPPSETLITRHRWNHILLHISCREFDKTRYYYEKILLQEPSHYFVNCTWEKPTTTQSIPRKLAVPVQMLLIGAGNSPPPPSSA